MFEQHVPYRETCKLLEGLISNCPLGWGRDFVEGEEGLEDGERAYVSEYYVSVDKEGFEREVGAPLLSDLLELAPKYNESPIYRDIPHAVVTNHTAELRTLNASTLRIENSNVAEALAQIILHLQSQ